MQVNKIYVMKMRGRDNKNVPPLCFHVFSTGVSYTIKLIMFFIISFHVIYITLSLFYFFRIPLLCLASAFILEHFYHPLCFYIYAVKCFCVYLRNPSTPSRLTEYSKIFPTHHVFCKRMLFFYLYAVRQ
jgi:hypothetical protein